MSGTHVEEAVRNAVAQALERQLPDFRESLVKQVVAEVTASLGGKTEPSGNAVAALQRAVSAIQEGTTQKEILRTLLENSVLYSGRAMLFVVKNGTATGWNGTGFSDADVLKDFSLDMGCALAGRVMQSRNAELAGNSDFDQQFLSTFGSPADGKVVLLPLVLKDKVSALVYADAGNDGSTLDFAALDVLVRATSAWLEVISQRKLAAKEGSPEPEMSAAPVVNDPFAAHLPLHSQVHAEPEPAVAMAAAAASGAVSSIPSGEEGEIHRKAQRFARLLMDEIKLYNQAKVSEGRKHKDLYDRLKEDIEKSRTTYHKRYGNSAAAAGDYFNQELIHSLAEDDVSLLGNNFRR